MRRLLLLLGCALVMALAAPAGLAADAAPAGETAPAPAAADQERMNTMAAAAATASGRATAASPDLLEHLVDGVLELFDVRSSGNTATHYVISSILLVGALLLRRIVTGVVFAWLRKLAAKTRTTLDDKLFPALEIPVGVFVMVIGIFAALAVLKLSAATDAYIEAGSHVAFSLAIFWILWRTLGTLLAHAQEIASARNSGIAAFMPWIRKALMSVFVVFGVLLTIQSLGFDVKTILAGLGIGGLAFALAAQDTLANIFGAIVVAIDQPFRIGEFVRVAGNVGGIEDIGLRSTRIRLLDKSLMIIPNKTMAAEAITNLSRFTQRRNEQVIGLTYDTKPVQMDEMVGEIQRIILGEDGVDPASVMVFFRDFGASSLDIWIVYVSKAPDFLPYMAMRQRINLSIMRAVEARGLSIAFPTQAIRLEGEIAEKLIDQANR